MYRKNETTEYMESRMDVTCSEETWFPENRVSVWRCRRPVLFLRVVCGVPKAMHGEYREENEAHIRV